MTEEEFIDFVDDELDYIIGEVYFYGISVKEDKSSFNSLIERRNTLMTRKDKLRQAIEDRLNENDR